MKAAAYHSEKHQLLAKTEGGVWKTKNFQREIVGLLKKKLLSECKRPSGRFNTKLNCSVVLQQLCKRDHHQKKTFPVSLPQN